MKINDALKILDIGKDAVKIFSEIRESQAAESSRYKKSPVISEEMTPEEEDALIEKTKDKLSGHSLSSPTEVVATLKAFTEAATEAVKFCEVQETKREEIRANRDIRIKQIEAQRDTIMSYLERSFDERKYLFEQQFKVVDHALLTGNIQELALSLQSINELAKSSPFKALTDIGNVQHALSQEGSTFDI